VGVFFFFFLITRPDGVAESKSCNHAAMVH
jgi:hypothetical protein